MENRTLPDGEPPSLGYAGISDVRKELRGRPDRPPATACPAALGVGPGGAPGGPSPAASATMGARPAADHAPRAAALEPAAGARGPAADAHPGADAVRLADRRAG